MRKQLCPLTDLEFEVTRLLRAKVTAVSAEAGARLAAICTPAPPDPKKVMQDGKAAFECTVCSKICKRLPDYKKHFRTHGDSRPYPCRIVGCGKRFKVQKHLEYHLQLHATPDLFGCGIDGCRKNFSNPSSLRIHRLLDHESPGSETSIERQLREELTLATNELDRTKELLATSQQNLSTTQAEAREVRKQIKMQQPRLHTLRREFELASQGV